ncbi:hypothetical protein ISCGN_002787 [Ixodes scapularis]
MFQNQDHCQPIASEGSSRLRPVEPWGDTSNACGSLPIHPATQRARARELTTGHINSAEDKNKTKQHICAVFETIIAVPRRGNISFFATKNIFRLLLFALIIYKIIHIL